MSEEPVLTLPEQSETFIKRELYIAHDLINKLNYVKNVLKSMFPTGDVKDLNVMVGEGSSVERLAKEHLAYVEQCLKEKEKENDR